MDERERKRALYRWKDGEIPASEAAEIEEHLAECEDCRKAADVVDAVRQHIATWTPPAAPEDLKARVLERIRGQAARVISLKSQLRLTAAAAALLLVASLSAIPFLPGTGRPDAPPPVENIADVALDTMMTEFVEDYLPAVNGEGGER